MSQPTDAPLAPPMAAARVITRTEHGVVRPDPYAWLAETDSEAVLAHLRAERAYYDAASAHLHSLVEDLASEMTSRVPVEERSPEWSRRRFSYYIEHRAGSEYGAIRRRIRAEQPYSETISVVDPDFTYGLRTTGEADSGPARAETVLDLDALDAGTGHLEVGLTLVSPDEDLLAYSVDTDGDEVYALAFRDLRTGQDLPERVARSYYGGAWSADSRQFFYTVHDAAYRPHQVWRHAIGTPVEQDVLVLEEPDESFALHLRGTRSGDLVVILAESRSTSETWVVDAHDPQQPPRSVGGRRHGVGYRVEHAPGPHGGELLVLTDDGAQELRLVRAPVPGPEGADHTTWSPVREEDPAERLERLDVVGGHAVLSVRREAEHRLRVLPLDDLAGEGVLVSSRFPCGAVHLARSTDPGADHVIVVDRAHLQPAVWSRVDLATGRLTDVHHQNAPGLDPTAYVTERHRVTSTGGASVPVTVVRRRGTPLDGTAPALLWAYGAYEYTFEPEFAPARPRLLDRGVVFAHGHGRGGGEGGRRWWLDGRLEHKQHTFDDLLAAADGLDGLVDGTRLATRGLSAGGLLQGAVLSQRPERWRAVVAEVPFVDVVTTMLDASIPLTVNEWEEWGDPRRPEEHAWMLAYSPYDNLPAAGSRPDLLVTGALHDPRVMVHEPAKWVAALRAGDPEWGARCVFRCETGAGAHSGPSGRHAHLHYEAEVLAWVLDRVGAR